MDFSMITAVRENGLGTITVNRPDKLNALNAQTVQELHTAFISFRDDPAVRAVILTGSGDKAFIAGADIKEMADPGIIKRSRVERIAIGSGTGQEDVRELLRYYRKMKKMMKTMGSGRKLERIMKRLGGGMGM